MYIWGRFATPSAPKAVRREFEGQICDAASGDSAEPIASGREFTDAQMLIALDEAAGRGVRFAGRTLRRRTIASKKRRISALNVTKYAE